MSVVIAGAKMRSIVFVFQVPAIAFQEAAFASSSIQR
jgi:hypothetical protein